MMIVRFLLQSFASRRDLVPLAILCALVTGACMSTADSGFPPPVDRVLLPKKSIIFDDGDTIEIRWPGRTAEVVRILGIDTPEVLHIDHNIPYPQAFGYEAAGFLRGCMATAEKVELLRSAKKDPYGRTLGYIFVDGKNYSALVIKARLAVESISHYGDNGLPQEAAQCLQAAKQAGPVPFEAPHLYRARMRKVAAWMKERNIYPNLPEKK
jgi:endonuclease YncB( thermonuclease family)